VLFEIRRRRTKREFGCRREVGTRPVAFIAGAGAIVTAEQNIAESRRDANRNPSTSLVLAILDDDDDYGVRSAGPSARP